MSADNLDTKPTIETVLERINALTELFQHEISKVHEELGKVNERLDGHETRFDRLEKVVLQTRLEFVELRDDFREWRKQLKDVLPPVA